MTILRCLLAAIPLLALGAGGDEPAPRNPGPPVATYEGDFSAISAVRELADGRLLLTDFREPALWLVDLRTGTRRQLGRQGAGPNEYQKPGGLYPGHGDSTLVLDRGQYRVLVVDPRGRLSGTRSIAISGSSAFSDRDVDLQRLDADGEAIQVAINMRNAGADSITLVRWIAERQRMDTVARIQQGERVRPPGASPMVGLPVHFAAADGWGVAADGRVVIVQPEPYRVSWIGRDGRVTHGPVVPIDVIPVTDADRKAVLDRASSAPNPMLGFSGRGGKDPHFTVIKSEPKFAERKPPFDPADVRVAPDGRVWVKRYEPAGEDHAIYDVFDAGGRRVDRVAFGPRRHVVGFGAHAVYVSRLDDDDLPHLEKYRM